MKLLVLSDIHDHVNNLEAVLVSAPARACGALLCCGDLCSPFVIDILDRGFDGPVHVVFGNNDGDQFLITAKADRIDRAREKQGLPPRFHLHGQHMLFPNGSAGSLSGIAACHYPGPSVHLARSGDFRAVFCGHSHLVGSGKEGSCLLVNPGAVMGWAPGGGKVPVSFAVYDSDPAAEAPGRISFYQVTGGRVHALDKF